MKETVKDKDNEIKEMIAKLKTSMKDASKFRHMEEYIAELEREKDEHEAKLKLVEETMKQKYTAEANSKVRTLKEKLQVALQTIEARDSELEYLASRLEELEMSATNHSV